MKRKRAPPPGLSAATTELAEAAARGQADLLGAIMDSLVVDPVGSGEHEDRDATAGGDDAPGDLVAGGAGDVGGNRLQPVPARAEAGPTAHAP
jgi:hypothetical protein